MVQVAVTLPRISLTIYGRELSMAGEEHARSTT